VDRLRWQFLRLAAALPRSPQRRGSRRRRVIRPGKLIADETEKLGKVIRSVNIKAE
jgi:hypothetical protein